MPFRMTEEVEQILCMLRGVEGGGGNPSTVTDFQGMQQTSFKGALKESLHTGLNPGDGCQYKCGGCSDWCIISK